MFTGTCQCAIMVTRMANQTCPSFIYFFYFILVHESRLFEEHTNMFSYVFVFFFQGERIDVPRQRLPQAAEQLKYFQVKFFI